jgi:hypothetical protein
VGLALIIRHDEASEEKRMSSRKTRQDQEEKKIKLTFRRRKIQNLTAKDPVANHDHRKKSKTPDWQSRAEAGREKKANCRSSSGLVASCNARPCLTMAARREFSTSGCLTATGMILKTLV